MIEEGYIKYNCNWINKSITIPTKTLNGLNDWRTCLFDNKLIGIYDNGIGFGNISSCHQEREFYITGSATGNKRVLSLRDYALVNQWNFSKNFINCIGEIKASSESLSHAAIYETNKSIQSVIHVHSLLLWEKHLNTLPTTSKEITYGTPEMAIAINNILKKQNYPNNGIIIMGGHQEGIISYGKSIEEAGKIIMAYFTNL